MTTIELPTPLLAQIKIYCIYKDMPQSKFVELLCSRDEEFKRFIKKAKKLNL